MALRPVIRQIVLLPQLFDRGDDTLYSLLEQSGYFVSYATVTEEDLRAAFAAEPAAVEPWIELCETKRVDSGWFIDSDRDHYLLWYRARNGKRFEEAEYTDRLDAIAAYVKRDIEGIRTKGESDYYLELKSRAH